MSFLRFTRARPCPICQGTHACSATEDGLHLCKRRHGEPADGFDYIKESKDGTWGLYRAEDAPPPWVRHSAAAWNAAHPGAGRPPEASEAPRGGRGGAQPTPWERFGGWSGLTAELAAHPEQDAKLAAYAAGLGVSADSLRALGCLVWPGGPRYQREDGTVVCEPDELVTPERDGAGAVVGAARREAGSGRKIHVKGGRRGLCYPPDVRDRPGPLYVPEGATSTPACLTLGLAAVGRPSCDGGVEHLAALLRSLPPGREVVVLGERDRHQTDRGEWVWPGLDRALDAARRLAVQGRPIRVALTPGSTEDVRRWLDGERGEMPGEGAKDARVWLNRAACERGIELEAPWAAVELDALGEEFERALVTVEVCVPTARVPVGALGAPDTSDSSHGGRGSESDSGRGAGRLTAEELAELAAAAREKLARVKELAGEVLAAVKPPPSAEEIDLSDLGDCVGDVPPGKGKRAKGCGCAFEMSKDGRTIHMCTFCCRWCCGLCVRHLRQDWREHLPRVVGGRERLYCAIVPRRAWPSILRGFSAARKRGEGAEHWRYDQRGDTIFVMSSAPPKIPKKYNVAVVEVDGGTAAALTDEIISRIPVSDKKPIFTSRGWKRPPKEKSGWTRGRPVGRHSLAEHQAILARHGVASRAWNWKKQPWSVAWVVEVLIPEAMQGPALSAMYAELRPETGPPLREAG
jgi:hypothetical protein